MKNQLLKPLVIAIALVLVPLSISTAQATQTNQGQKGDKGDKGDKGNDGQGSFTYSNTCGGTDTTPGNKPCKIGTRGPGGGWIFFVDYNNQYPGFTYLEAAPIDTAAVAWCNNTSTSIPAVAGWAANAVGKGQANTKAMLDWGCTSGAAYEADKYFTPTNDDWFLPSEGELMLMYTNLRQAGVGGFANYYYWSSTELGSDIAWIQFFNNGNQDGGSKYNTLPVRAVRAF